MIGIKQSHWMRGPVVGKLPARRDLRQFALEVFVQGRAPWVEATTTDNYGEDDVLDAVERDTKFKLNLVAGYEVCLAGRL